MRAGLKNPVAQAALEVIEEHFRDDPPYVADKSESLAKAGDDTGKVLLWCANLDGTRKAALADRLGVPLDHLKASIQTMQKIFG